MQSGKPSRTALGAAGHRAAHQVLEHGSIFSDPLALRILGSEAEAAIEEAQTKPEKRWLRLFIALRTRFAEDALAAALTRDTSQIVVLGAGLDTYAYRSSIPEGARVFEVDHPATQIWKRELLAAASIVVPDSVTFVPIDFEREHLVLALRAAGFEPTRRSFFSWLGVVPYLTEDAVFATLKFIAELTGGAEVVFDYPAPSHAIEDAQRRAHRESLEAHVAAEGEPFRCHLEASMLSARLKDLGFQDIDDLGASQIAARYFPQRKSTTTASGGGGHVVHART
jgi:methyltransferase (TIGR00027 family)